MGKKWFCCLCKQRQTFPFSESPILTWQGERDKSALNSPLQVSTLKLKTKEKQDLRKGISWTWMPSSGTDSRPRALLLTPEDTVIPNIGLCCAKGNLLARWADTGVCTWYSSKRVCHIVSKKIIVNKYPHLEALLGLSLFLQLTPLCIFGSKLWYLVNTENTKGKWHGSFLVGTPATTE